MSADPKTRPSQPATEKRAPFEGEHRPIVRVLHTLNACFSRCYHRTIVLSPQRLPETGPAILVCNHTSGLDPLLIQSACRRAVIWMMAKEYYNLPVLYTFFRTIDVIPVDRGGKDLASTRSALRALAAGRVLGVFPEGRIERTRDLMPFQPGVAMMAIRAKVPVYPAYLDGSQRRQTMINAFLSRNNATLTFGPPVAFDRSSTSKESLEAATAAIQGAVKALKRFR